MAALDIVSPAPIPIGQYESILAVVIIFILAAAIFGYQRKGFNKYKNTVSLQNSLNLELGRCGMRVRALVDEFYGSIWLGKEENNGVARLPVEIVCDKKTTAHVSGQCLRFEGTPSEIAPKMLIGLAYFIKDLAEYKSTISIEAENENSSAKPTEDKQGETKT